MAPDTQCPYFFSAIDPGQRSSRDGNQHGSQRVQRSLCTDEFVGGLVSTDVKSNEPLPRSIGCLNVGYIWVLTMNLGAGETSEVAIRVYHHDAKRKVR